MAKRRSELAARMGLTRKQVEETLQESVMEAAELVAEEFRRILVSLNADSVDAVFTGYSVTKIITSKLRHYKNFGEIHVPQVQIYVEASDAHKAMEPPLNIFDILDEGRDALPWRSSSEGPYPLWSLRTPSLVKGPGGKRAPGGLFKISRPVRTFKGSRPEKMRQALIGPRPEGATYSPAVFTQGPISSVPPQQLYKRVYGEAKRKLKANGFKDFDLIQVGRTEE